MMEFLNNAFSKLIKSVLQPIRLWQEHINQIVDEYEKKKQIATFLTKYVIFLRGSVKRNQF